MLDRLSSLFSGLSRAHGEYVIDDTKGVKQKGKALTKKAKVTLELWEAHTLGKKGLGIIPIKDNSCVSFAAIDIDSYENFDPINIANVIEKNDWPLVVCRSKSGGAHVFVFFSEECEAQPVRAKMKEIATVLGHPTAEIFPKQDRLQNKEDIGNWINMPYFDHKRTTRYAIHNEDSLDLAEFLDYAESKRTTLSDFLDLEVSNTEFEGMPPCLETLIVSGFPKGSMNNALFNMGVYARMKYPEDWHKKIYEYNDRFMGPGSSREVQQIIKSIDKKKYAYKCQEDPICGYCNKVICGGREFGITSGNSPYKSTNATKVSRPCILDKVEEPVECYIPPEGSDDEPYWIFRIHGMPMDVSIDMIQSQSKFLREYLKKFRKMVLPIDETRWMTAINNILENATNHELASDAGPEGHLFIHLESFATGKVQARTKDELVLGKPWNDKENEEGNGNLVYFRSPDFMKYLDMQRFKQFKERQIYAILRRNGANHHKFMIKGKCVACWSVPAYDSVQGTFDVPPMAKEQF